MSHFLARLVERARGTAARVEPLVTPRFAPIAIIDIASEVEASPPDRRDQQPKAENVSSPRAVIQQESQAEPKILRESDKSSPAPEIVAPDPKPEKLLVPTMIATDPTVVVRRPQARDRPALLVKNSAVKKESVAARPAKRLRSGTPGTTALRNLERGAVMPNESPEQPPIVRVTIGRIDVRATPPTAALRKSSTRSEPKLTLDAYLKSRREGTR